jgi:hypothetical protein
MTRIPPLDPYEGPDEIEPLTGRELIELVAFYRRTADQNGEPHDPEWSQWLREDPEAAAILASMRSGR